MVRYIAENEEDYKTLHEPPAAAYLVLLVSGRPSHAFPLRGEVQVGREKNNAIVVADHKVSRHHAVMIPIDNTYILTDQGSANGTYLNGVQIAQPTRLKHNDRLTVGDTTFLFTIGQPDLATLEHSASPPPPASASLSQPPSPATTGPSADNNTPIWIVIGCMAVVIIALLFVLALVLGLYVGSGQSVGSMVIRLI